MSNKEFENYVALIGKLLQLTRAQRELIAGELQDHLQMRVADLESEGMARQDAITKALEEFGDAAVMAKNFQTVLNLKRRRWMMRFATVSMAAAFLATILTMALWPDNARFGAPAHSVAQDAGSSETTEAAEESSFDSRLSNATQRDLQTEKALKKVVDLDFEETPFSEIMSVLAEMTNLNFILDNSARDDSLTDDEPISFRIRQLPLDKALDLMLVGKNATYRIDEGVVVFISLDDAGDAKFMRLKMFDCRDMMDVLPASVAMSGTSVGGGGYGGSGGGGGGLFSVPQGLQLPAGSTNAGPETTTPNNANGAGDPKPAVAAKAPEPPPASREATLLNLIFTMVDPESWEQTNGMASAQVVNGILVVRQQESSFRKIEHLLVDLNANVLPPKAANRANRIRRQNADPISNVSKKNPFGNNSTTRNDNPFGNSSSNSNDDPFGKQTESQDDPFGKQTESQGDPFGSQ